MVKECFIVTVDRSFVAEIRAHLSNELRGGKGKSKQNHHSKLNRDIAHRPA
jgi:hypothetical protein